MTYSYVNDVETEYKYRPDGLRHSKNNTVHIWDGANIVGDVGGATYVRGIGLIKSGANYCMFNAHGDVVQLANGSGNIVRSYDYDAFGVEKSPDEMDVNPWRYCGEYYDVETGTVYLRARYYNPTLGRFTSEDPAGDGLNWYTYCANNPVGFVDPWGLAKVNTVDYAIAMGGTVEYYTNTDGKKCVRITANGITQGYICNSGKIDDTVLNATFGWSFLTDDHRAAGFGIAIIEGKLYLDITDTLYDRMNVAIKDGQSIWVPVTLYWFYKQMNHMGDWDIKESDSWNKTLGKNTFPGNDAKVFFAGMLFDPPALGNFTYGYIGAGVGIPQVVIAGGSAFAEVTSNLSNPLALFKPDNIKGELRGQYYAALGYLHYYQVTVNNILSLVGGKR